MQHRCARALERRDDHRRCEFLLENLGFVVNYPKSQQNPTQEIDFLGFTVNSVNFTIKLPAEKIKKTRSEAKTLLKKTVHSAIAISRLLGKLNHAAQAIPPAPLFYRNLQTCLQEALQRGTRITISHADCLSERRRTSCGG